MSKDMTLRFIGTDYWDREVFQDVATKRFYKRESYGCIENNSFYTTSDFDGEPGFPINKSITVHLINY